MRFVFVITFAIILCLPWSAAGESADSSVGLVEVSASADNVVYVLDKGLIRFGKFVGAALGIFALVGLFLFGYDIKRASEKATQAKLDAERTSIEIEKNRVGLNAKIDEIERQIARIEMLEREVVRHRDEASKAASQVGRLIAEMRSKAEEAGAILIEMRELGVTEATVAVTRRDEMGITAERGRLWSIGSTLRFRFLDGEERLRGIVREAIEIWSEHVNLKVDESSDDNAEVRISFNQPGSWSYIGTDALGVSREEPTLNYGFLADLQGEQAMQTALHEFGHTLGLVHEFQNPQAGEIFNREAVVSHFTGPPNHWPLEQIEHSMLRKVDAYPGSRPYDPQSIMNFEFPTALFVPGKETQPLKILSESDKSYVASLYPS